MASIHAKGRDNARTPMQWDSSPNAGFSTGIPWLKVNPNYVDINAAAQLNDTQSIFNYYRQLINLRKKNPVLIEGSFQLLLPEDEDIFAYIRELDGERVLVLANFHDKQVQVTGIEDVQVRELLISNYDSGHIITTLRPYEAGIFGII